MMAEELCPFCGETITEPERVSRTHMDRCLGFALFKARKDAAEQQRVADRKAAAARRTGPCKTCGSPAVCFPWCECSSCQEAEEKYATTAHVKSRFAPATDEEGGA